MSDSKIIKRFFKGLFRLKPPRPKYNQVWNTDTLLNYLEGLPVRDVNIKTLSEKLATLLALVSAHRVQTLSLIKIQNIVVSQNGIEIKIPDLIKTSGPGRYQPLIEMPFFTDRPEICAAKTLQCYLDVTKDIRKTDRLFVALKRPHKEVSAATISRWIKLTLQKSGIDTTMFSAHSTRHATTSKAYARGVDIEVIRNKAGWSKNSEVFARFYKRPIVPDSSQFALAIFGDNND